MADLCHLVLPCERCAGKARDAQKRVFVLLFLVFIQSNSIDIIAALVFRRRLVAVTLTLVEQRYCTSYIPSKKKLN